MSERENCSAESERLVALKEKLETFSKAELIEELMAALLELASTRGGRKQ